MCKLPPDEDVARSSAQPLALRETLPLLSWPENKTAVEGHLSLQVCSMNSLEN